MFNKEWDIPFVDTENDFVSYPYLKKVRSAPVRYVHARVVCPDDGIFIVQSNCHRTCVLSSLKSCACWAKVELGYGRIVVRDRANAGWINYMLKDSQKSEFDGFLDCIILESWHNPIADA